MTAYEIYCCDRSCKYHFVGLLRERRRNPMIITRESVMKWGETFLTENPVIEKTDTRDIYFIQVEF